MGTDLVSGPYIIPLSKQFVLKLMQHPILPSKPIQQTSPGDSWSWWYRCCTLSLVSSVLGPCSTGCTGPSWCKCRQSFHGWGRFHPGFQWLGESCFMFKWPASCPGGWLSWEVLPWIHPWPLGTGRWFRWVECFLHWFPWWMVGALGLESMGYIPEVRSGQQELSTPLVGEMGSAIHLSSARVLEWASWWNLECVTLSLREVTSWLVGSWAWEFEPLVGWGGGCTWHNHRYPCVSWLEAWSPIGRKIASQKGFHTLSWFHH